MMKPEGYSCRVTPQGRGPRLEHHEFPPGCRVCACRKMKWQGGKAVLNVGRKGGDDRLTK